MFKNILNKITNYKAYIGKHVFSLILITASLGVFWFGIEAFFLIVIQGFLISIGIEFGVQPFLPKWYPLDLVSNILILIGFGFLRGLVMYFRAYMAGMTGVTFVNTKRAEILEKAFYEKNIKSVSEVIDIFSDKIFHSGTLIQELTQALYLMFVIALYCMLGLYIAPVEFLFAGACFSIFVFNQKYVQKSINRASHGIWASWKKVFDTLYWGLQNNFLIKLYGLERKETVKARTGLAEYLDFYRSYYKVIGMRASLTNMMAVCIVAALTYISISVVKTEPMKLVGLFYLFLRLAGSSAEMNGHFNSLKLYKPQFDNVKKYLEEYSFAKVDTDSLEKKFDLSDSNIELSVKDLSFSYNSKYRLLEGINFKLKQGQLLLIKGESGSGKSTLLSLLFGLNDPSTGTITFNGHAIKDIRASLFDLIAYVGPDPYLLSGTVRENLLYTNSRQNISDEEIMQAAHKAQVKNLIESFPSKLNEFLNEKTQVSTGQKQRLSLARALLRDPKILILDEATANLDKDTEVKIIDVIKAYSKKTMIIVVSHKDTFDSIADIRIDLEKSFVISEADLEAMEKHV